MKITRKPRWPEKSRWARFFAEGAGKGGKRPYSRSVIRRPGGKCRRSGCGEESPARPRSCFCPVFCALQTKSRKASFPAVAELFKKSFGRGSLRGIPFFLIGFPQRWTRPEPSPAQRVSTSATLTSFMSPSMLCLSAEAATAKLMARSSS